MSPELVQFILNELERIVSSGEPLECRPARVLELCEQVIAQYAASPEERTRLTTLFDVVMSQ